MNVVLLELSNWKKPIRLNLFKVDSEFVHIKTEYVILLKVEHIIPIPIQVYFQRRIMNGCNCSKMKPEEGIVLSSNIHECNIEDVMRQYGLLSKIFKVMDIQGFCLTT